MSERTAMEKVMDAIRAKKQQTEGLSELNIPITPSADKADTKPLTEYEKALLEFKDQEG